MTGKEDGVLDNGEVVYDSGQHLTVSISAAIEAVEDATGLRGGYLDQTGGNCAAMRWNLDGGAYLLVTDGDVFTYSGGDSQPFFDGWVAGVYVDDGDPVGFTSTGRTSVAALVQCIGMALRADGEHLVADETHP